MAAAQPAEVLNEKAPLVVDTGAAVAEAAEPEASPFGRLTPDGASPRARQWDRGQIDTYTVDDVYEVWVPEQLKGLFPDIIVQHVRQQFRHHEITGAALMEMRCDEDLMSCDLDETLVRYGDRVQLLEKVNHCRVQQRGTWQSLTFDQKVSHPALITCAVLAMGLLLVYLSFILVPLVMSVFFSYFLQPIVDLLADRPYSCVCCEKRRVCCASWCGNSGSGAGKRVAGYRKLLVRVTGDSKTHPNKCCGYARCTLKSVLLLRLPRWLAVATAFAVFALIITGVTVLSAHPFCAPPPSCTPLTAPRPVPRVLAVMNAVDKMLDRRDEYEARWDELYNTTSEFMEGFDVDLDQMLDSGGDSGGAAVVEVGMLVFSGFGRFFMDFSMVSRFCARSVCANISVLGQC